MVVAVAGPAAAVAAGDDASLTARNLIEGHLRVPFSFCADARLLTTARNAERVSDSDRLMRTVRRQVQASVGMSDASDRRDRVSGS